MTLKKVIDCSEIKNIAPVMVQSYPSGSGSLAGFKDIAVELHPKIIEAITCFKQTFDILRHVKPETNNHNEALKIEMRIKYDAEKPIKYNIRIVKNCDDETEVSVLTKEIFVEDGIIVADSPLTKEEFDIINFLIDYFSSPANLQFGYGYREVSLLFVDGKLWYDIDFIFRNSETLKI